MIRGLSVYIAWLCCTLLFPLALVAQEGDAIEARSPVSEESLNRVDAERERLKQIQGEAPHKGLSLLIIKPESLDGDDGSENDSIIADSINSMVKQAGLINLVSESAPNSSQSLSEIISAARDLNVNLVLFVNYFSEGRRSTIIARIYETWNGRLISGDVQSAQGELGLLSAIDKSMTNIIDGLSIDAERIRAEWGIKTEYRQTKSLSFISSDEGASISLAGNVLGVIEDGKLFLPIKPLALGQELDIEIQKDQYYSKKITVVLEEEDAIIALPALYAKNNFTAGILWVPLSPVSWGAFFRYMPVPDQWYIQAAWTMASPDDGWYEDLNRIDFNDGSTSSELSLFNQDLLVVPERSFAHRFGFETGFYVFSPADQIVKFSIGFGIEAILAGSRDMTGANLLFSLPVIGAELNLHPFIIGFQASLDFSVNAFGTPVLPEGAISTFLPFRVYVGYQW